METLEFIKKAEGGKVVIDIPENLEGKELKIKITENEHEIDELKKIQDELKKFQEMTGEERIKELMKYCGTAKYPDVDLDKYSVYEQ
ncbi:MAG: hypothetical protein ACR2FN_04600 [Chitinophagaceae bacterium]